MRCAPDSHCEMRHDTVAAQHLGHHRYRGAVCTQQHCLIAFPAAHGLTLALGGLDLSLLLGGHLQSRQLSSEQEGRQLIIPVLQCLPT